MGWQEMVATVRAYETHPPFYYSLLKLWQMVFGASNMSLRASSLLAGVALLPLGYACARQARINPLIVAGLFALNRPLLIAARQARSYALFILIYAAAIWVLLRIKRGSANWQHWALYLVLLEAMLWLHALGIFFGAALGLALLIGLERRYWRVFIIVHTIAAVMWLPCLYMIVVQDQHRLHGWLTFSASDIWPRLTEGLIGLNNGVLGALAIGLAVLGVASLGARDERKTALTLLILCVTPVLLEITISALKTPIYLPRYFSPAVVPFLMLTAAAPNHPKWGWIGGFALGLCALFSLIISVHEINRPPEERWDAIGAYLNSHVRKGEEVWTIPTDLKMFLSMAAPPTYPIIGQPVPFPASLDYPGTRPAGTMAVPGINTSHVTDMIAQARARHRTGLWVISSRIDLFDPSDALHKQLSAAGRRDLVNSDYDPILLEHWVLNKP